MVTIKTFTVGYLGTNCYVVSTDLASDAIIVDAGGGFEKIKKYLFEIGKTAKIVLCTHGHFDHVLDAHKWQKEGAKIYIHDEDSDFLRGKQIILPNEAFIVTPIEANVLLKGNEEISYKDISIKVINTPGHSKGGVSYILNEHTIFSGDTVFFHSYGRTDFYGGDLMTLAKSVKRILDYTDDARILPGHGESTTILEERNFNPLYNF